MTIRAEQAGSDYFLPFDQEWALTPGPRVPIPIGLDRAGEIELNVSTFGVSYSIQRRDSLAGGV